MDMQLRHINTETSNSKSSHMGLAILTSVALFVPILGCTQGRAELTMSDGTQLSMKFVDGGFARGRKWDYILLREERSTWKKYIAYDTVLELDLFVRLPISDDGDLAAGGESINAYAFLMGSRPLRTWHAVGGTLQGKRSKSRWSFGGDLQLKVTFSREDESDVGPRAVERLLIENASIEKDQELGRKLFQPVFLRLAPGLEDWKDDLVPGTGNMDLRQ